MAGKSLPPHLILWRLPAAGKRDRQESSCHRPDVFVRDPAGAAPAGNSRRSRPGAGPAGAFLHAV